MTNPSPSSPPLGVSKAMQELVDGLATTAMGDGCFDLDDVDTAKAALLTAIAALEAQVPQWQPIETAPSGKELILYFPCTGQRHSPSEMVKVCRYPTDFPRQATHWMPLLPAPTRP